MKALDRKLLRDLRLMWSQALTIALVVASGIGGFITSLSAVDSLALARDRFYAEGRFADVFAAVKRAPNALAEHAYRLSQAFSKFYAACPMLSAEPVVRSSRLTLAGATLRQLELALDLLGISVPERM